MQSLDLSVPLVSPASLQGGLVGVHCDLEPKSPHPPKVLKAGTELGQLLGERYVVLDRIGQGGMADVFLARDSFLGHFVAVKLLAKGLRGNKSHRDRMLREAELAVAVRHPRVVETFDAGVAADGTPFIVLEALVGETLHDFLERNHRMPVQQALPLLRQLAEGLRAAHQVGIVHGDVKPKNVFLCGPLDAPHCLKLIDFGLARLAGPTSHELDGETVAGTLEYLAPEQALAEATDERADVYSFGVVAFRWLTGELPFDTELSTQLIAHQLASAAPPMRWLQPDLPTSLDGLVQVAMRKAKENRYASMDALLADLDAVEAGEATFGVPVATLPDAYHPETALGRKALSALLRADHSRLSLTTAT
jgi:serine/threonine-protein kinase